jgi:hypothetical protein
MDKRLTHFEVSCSVCHRPVKGNVNGEKVVTCGRCVQLLLTASHENKIRYRDKLKELGDLEGARSIESFIVEQEGNGMVATPSKYLPSKCPKTTFKTVQTVSKSWGK